MAIPITIPRLGWNMEEGIFLGWLKADGEPVRAGDMLFRLESEKATEDIECLDAGILRIPSSGPQEGDTVPVGCVIGYLTLENEDIPVADGKVRVEPSTIAVDSQPAASAKCARALSQTPIATPRARRMAAELGLDWTKLQGTGRGGRIRARDVGDARGRRKIVPLTALRKVGIARLVESARTTVPVTLTTTADVSEIVKRRQRHKVAGELAPSVTDFFVQAVARALQDHPIITASRSGDDHLVFAAAIHVGIAVDTDAGLLVPVVHEEFMSSLQRIASRTRDLIARARLGTLMTKDLQGGVFTITNLGMYGIDAFTPVINYPECAILGVGRIRRSPVVESDEIVIRDQVTLSLTFDHRIVDGAPAARFLQTLTTIIEKPNFT